jgi:acetyltransferase EpsM
MTNKIVIWGASGHARVVADILRVVGEYTLVGFIDEVDASRKGQLFVGAPVLGGAEVLVELRQAGVTHGIVAIGDCWVRMRRLEMLRAAGIVPATLVHPRAVISQDSGIGEGTVVAAGAVVSAGATLGKGVIVNTGATVDHDCTIGDSAHICPGAHLAGNVTVGERAWVGIGAVVTEKTRIGADSLIGAGSVVVSDIPDGVVAYGVPARVIRARD